MYRFKSFTANFPFENHIILGWSYFIIARKVSRLWRLSRCFSSAFLNQCNGYQSTEIWVCSLVVSNIINCLKILSLNSNVRTTFSKHLYLQYYTKQDSVTTIFIIFFIWLFSFIILTTELIVVLILFKKNYQTTLLAHKI